MAEIFATEYNNLRSRINAVMVTDYGQTLNATANVVTGTSKVTAAQWNSLYIDMIRARTHQAAFTQQTLWLGNYNTNTVNTDKVAQADLTYLSGLMTTIETNNRVLDTVNQATISTIASSSRATAWNASVDHIVNVTFASAAARTHFFNAGGQIRLNANIVYTGSESKTLDWRSLLMGMGNIIMNHNQTVSSLNVGQTSLIGGLNLSTTPTQIYQRFAAAYTTNNYRIIANQNATGTTITFQIIFNDANTLALTAANRNDGYPDIDETVKGTLSSNIQAVTPAGTVSIGGTSYNTVVLAIPTGATTNVL